MTLLYEPVAAIFYAKIIVFMMATVVGGFPLFFFMAAYQKQKYDAEKKGGRNG